MKALKKSLAVLLGADPQKPVADDFTIEARDMHAAQRADKGRIQLLLAELEEKKTKGKPPERWRRRRWSVLILVNLLFVLSYSLDIQVLEGALTASRFVGFHMADLNSALQVMLAYKQVLINLLIGTVTVLIFWWILDGRTFCSWVCPYHLLAEWAEMIHEFLEKKKIVRDHPFDRRVRTLL